MPALWEAEAELQDESHVGTFASLCLKIKINIIIFHFYGT